MKIAGYTIAKNSIIGFKVIYTYINFYRSSVDKKFDTNESSRLVIKLILPGQQLELGAGYGKKLSKEFIANTEKALDACLIKPTTLKEIHGQDHTINTRN